MYAHTTWPPPGGTPRAAAGACRTGHVRAPLAGPRPVHDAHRTTTGPVHGGTDVFARPVEPTRDAGRWGR
ncbi:MULTISPECIES: hypothetical protein [Streptomyces]|uniref:hypothetical protein n=1 Tax=Streptomyces TaxID=1883 RepID=UPI000A5C6361|nr:MULTISPECIES: hypothetical protein [Streptomyces]